LFAQVRSNVQTKFCCYGGRLRAQGKWRTGLKVAMGSKGAFMKIDIGRVFSNTWAMIKERFWVLVGMVVTYFAVQMVLMMVLGTGMAVTFAGVGAALGDGDDFGLMAGGLGVGAIIMLILFYVAIFALTFAQQCSMTALATPMHRVGFGDAFKTGMRGGLTFLGIILAFIVAYIAFFIVVGILGAIFSIIGDVGAILVGIAMIPLTIFIIYVLLRVSVIVPVVAVDRVFNPITAIQNAWAMTKGNVLAIFVVYIVVSVVAGLLLLLPFGMMAGAFAAIGPGADASDAMGAIAAMFGVMLLFVPLFLIYSIVSVTIVACLHAEMSDTGTQSLEETFG